MPKPNNQTVAAVEEKPLTLIEEIKRDIKTVTDLETNSVVNVTITGRKKSFDLAVDLDADHLPVFTVKGNFSNCIPKKAFSINANTDEKKVAIRYSLYVVACELDTRNRTEKKLAALDKSLIDLNDKHYVLVTGKQSAAATAREINELKARIAALQGNL